MGIGAINVIESISAELTRKYGRDYSRTALFDMVHFAEAFPDEKIVHSLSEQLG